MYRFGKREVMCVENPFQNGSRVLSLCRPLSSINGNHVASSNFRMADNPFPV
jgi:hypothetical protein